MDPVTIGSLVLTPIVDNDLSADPIADEPQTVSAQNDLTVQSVAGDLIFKTGGVERARIEDDGTGTGLFESSLPASPSTGDAVVWNGTAWVAALIANANVDSAAAIARSKLNFGSGLVNADIASGAAIARSKLNFGSGLVNADIASGAAISASKISGLPSPVVGSPVTTTVTTTGTTYATGADVLSSALSFTADGASSYVVTVRASSWATDTAGHSARVSLNLDSAQGELMGEFYPGGMNYYVPLNASAVVVAPSAGTHTVNVKLWCGGSGTSKIVAGASGGTGGGPIWVSVEVF